MTSGTAVDNEALDPTNREPRDPLSIPTEVKASLNLLIVDDDRTLREGCASVLQMDGYNVTTLGRGDEALDLVKRRRFDIVLVDLYMTPVSGMEILKATLEVEQGHDRRRDDRQSERHDEHRGSARRRVGLSPEAVLRDAPAGPGRAGGACRDGRARDARPARRSCRSKPATATRSRCSASRRRSVRRSISPAKSRAPTPRS